MFWKWKESCDGLLGGAQCKVLPISSEKNLSKEISFAVYGKVTLKATGINKGTREHWEKQCKTDMNKFVFQNMVKPFCERKQFKQILQKTFSLVWELLSWRILSRRGEKNDVQKSLRGNRTQIPCTSVLQVHEDWQNDNWRNKNVVPKKLERSWRT